MASCTLSPRTLLTLVVLESLEASEGSTSSDRLVGEASLVLLEIVVVVDLLVVVLAAILQKVSELAYRVLWMMTRLTPEAHCEYV
jgi:hypothetical protein